MIRIDRLRWSPTNIAHIFRHGVLPREVEEVIAGSWLVEPSYAGRSLVIGSTRAGRLLAVVLEPEGNQVYFPVTARPASRKERRRYAQFQAGELS